MVSTTFKCLVAAALLATPASAQWFTYESGVPLPTVFSHDFALEAIESDEARALQLEGDEGTIEFFAGGGWFTGQAPTDLAHNLGLICVIANGRTSLRRESAYWTAEEMDPQYGGELNEFWYARYAIYLDGSSLYFQSGTTLHRVPLPVDIEPAKRLVHFAVVTEREGAGFTTRVYIDGGQPESLAGVGYGQDIEVAEAAALTVGGLPRGASGAVRLSGQRRTSNSLPFDVRRNVSTFQGAIGGVRVWSKPYGAPIFAAIGGAPRMRRYGQFDIERTLAFPRDGELSKLTVPRFRDLVAYSDFRGDSGRHRMRLPQPIEGQWVNELQSNHKARPVTATTGLVPTEITEVPVFSVRDRAQRPDPAARGAGLGAALLYRNGILVGSIVPDGVRGYRVDGADIVVALTFTGEDDRLAARLVEGDPARFGEHFGVVSEGVVHLVRPSMRLRGTIVNGGDPFLLANRVQNTNVASRGYDLRDMDLVNFDLDSGTSKLLLSEPGGRDWVLTDGGRVAPVWCEEISLTRGSAGIQVDTVMTERTLAKQMSVRYGARQAWPSGALSVNGSYRESSQSTDFRTQVRSYLSSWSREVILVVDPATLILAPDFEDGVRALRDGRVTARQFFDTYGTHYAHAMTYGALAVAEKTLDRRELGKEVARGFDVDASLKVGATYDATGRELTSTEVSGGGGNEKRVSTRKVFQTEVTEFRTIGATLNASLDGASASLGGVYPIQPDLRPIYELVSPIYFEDPEIYHRVRGELKQAFESMARALAREAPPIADDDAQEVIPPAQSSYHLRIDSAASSDDTWIFGSVSVSPFVRPRERVPVDSTPELEAASFGHVPYKAAYVDEETGAVRLLTDHGKSWLFRNLEDDGDFDGDNTLHIEEWTGRGHWRTFKDGASDYGIQAWTADSNAAYGAAHPDIVDASPGELHYVIHGDPVLARDAAGRVQHLAQVSAADDPQLELVLSFNLNDHREIGSNVPLLSGFHVLREGDFSAEHKFLELASGVRKTSLTKEFYYPEIARTRVVAARPLERMSGWFNLLVEFWAERPDDWRSDLAARLAAVEEPPPPLQPASGAARPEPRLVRVYPFAPDARTRGLGDLVGGADIQRSAIAGGALALSTPAYRFEADGLAPYGAIARLDFSLGTDARGFDLANDGGALTLQVREDGVRLRIAAGDGEPARMVNLHSDPLLPGTWHEVALGVEPDRVVWSFDGVKDSRRAREAGFGADRHIFGVRVPGAADPGGPTAEQEAAYAAYRAALAEGGTSLVQWAPSWTCRLIDPRPAPATGRGVLTRVDEVIFAAAPTSEPLDLAPFVARPRVPQLDDAPRLVASLAFEPDGNRASDPRLPARAPEARRSSFVPVDGARVVDHALEVESVAYLDFVRVRGSSTVHFDCWPGERPSELSIGALAVLIEGEAEGGARLALEVRARDGVAQRFECSARDLLERRAWHKVVVTIDVLAGELRMFVDGEALLEGLLDGVSCDALSYNDAGVRIKVTASAEPDVEQAPPRFDELIVVAGRLAAVGVRALLERERVVGAGPPPSALVRAAAPVDVLDASASKLRPIDASFAERVHAYYPIDGDLAEQSGRGGDPLASGGDVPAVAGDLPALAAPVGVDLGPALDPRAFTVRCSFLIESAPAPILALGSVELGSEPVELELPNGKKRVLPIGSALVLRLRSAAGVEIPVPLRFEDSGKQVIVPARPGAALPAAYQALESGAWRELLLSFDARAKRVVISIDGALLRAVDLPAGFEPAGGSGLVLTTGRDGAAMGARLDELLVLRGATEHGSESWTALEGRKRTP